MARYERKALTPEQEILAAYRKDTQAMVSELKLSLRELNSKAQTAIRQVGVLQREVVQLRSDISRATQVIATIISTRREDELTEISLQDFKFNQ